MKAFKIFIAATIIATPIGIAVPAQAQYHDHGWYEGSDRDWDPADHYDDGDYDDHRHMSEEDHVYRGHDGRYYCKRSNGTTGLVMGALGGGVLANVLGGGTLGTLLGAGGGALLGKHLDQRHDEAQNRRNDYVCD